MAGSASYNVHVISEEILKPSSQTPNQLRNLKLSFLDQLVPPAYIPLIFFYDQNQLITKHAQISQKLKQSLSEALTAFYPLAGKLDRANSTVDCNDSGVTYVEARVDARLSDAIRDPTTKQLRMYLPVAAASTLDDMSNVFLAVQINYFECGGIAVGVCLSHYVGDTVSLVTFVNSWAAICRRGAGLIIDPAREPSFDLASHFPARDFSGTNISAFALYRPPEDTLLVTKRFVFDKIKLAALRELAANSGSSSNVANNYVKDPTRVELVSSFIWEHFIQKSEKPNMTTTFAATQVVNVRKRINPSHDLERVFGNCIMPQIAMLDHDNKAGAVPYQLHDLIREIRTKTRGVNNEYIQKSRLGQDHEDYGGYVSDLESFFGLLFKGGLDVCGFTSWCRFPVYEVDFGWGNPVWVGTTGFRTKNFTVLMDTPSGDGVEAYINTIQDNIESLETLFKLL